MTAILVFVGTILAIWIGVRGIGLAIKIINGVFNWLGKWV